MLVQYINKNVVLKYWFHMLQNIKKTFTEVKLTVQQFDLGSLTFNLSNCTCTDDVYAVLICISY